MTSVRVLRPLFRLSLIAIVLMATALVSVWMLAFDSAPAVDRTAQLTPEHIERAQRILKTNDPRRLRTGTVRTVSLRAADVDVAINYLAGRYAGGSAEALFGSDRVTVRGSIRADSLPGRPYVNLESEVVAATAIPEIRRVRVGRLPVPAGVAQWLARQALGMTFTGDDLDMMARAIRQVTLEAQGATITYEWDSDIIDTVRAALVDSNDRARLRAYQEALADTLQAVRGNTVPLIQLMQPMFALARERSQSEDPVAENRAAILVLTLYANGHSLRDVVPEAREWRRPARRGVRLNRRGDLAQHYTVSAVLSANTGGPFANAVGIYKEVADSRGGSGFSFDDIAADRAGSRMGTMAETPTTARLLQERLSAATTEAIIMPAIDDLPGGLSEAEFQRQFGGVGATGHAQMLATIDARVAALPLFGP